jgi:hypothetical protein
MHHTILDRKVWWSLIEVVPGVSILQWTIFF